MAYIVDEAIPRIIKGITDCIGRASFLTEEQKSVLLAVDPLFFNTDDVQRAAEYVVFIKEHQRPPSRTSRHAYERQLGEWKYLNSK
jgi:hypothetical protein